MEKELKDPIGTLFGSMETIRAWEDGRIAELRKEALNTEIPGFEVDTVETVDCGWETGIEPEGQAWIIVERYESKELAVPGHAKWVKTLTENPKQELEDIDYA